MAGEGSSSTCLFCRDRCLQSSLQAQNVSERLAPLCRRRVLDSEDVKVDEVAASSGDLVLRMSLPKGYHYTQVRAGTATYALLLLVRMFSAFRKFLGNGSGMVQREPWCGRTSPKQTTEPQALQVTVKVPVAAWFFPFLLAFSSDR
jgi:hypothetical protein